MPVLGSGGPDLARPGGSLARWSDLRKRALSAALLAPMALACIWFGAGAWVGLLAVAAACLSAEWVVLCGADPWKPPGLIVPLTVLLAGIAGAFDHDAIGFALLFGGFFALWRAAGFPLAAGIPYVGVAAIALIWLRAEGNQGRANVLFLVLVVWASDIGAYAAGRLLGGPKLAPALSPGKTWSGAAGGLAAAMLVGEAVSGWFAPGLWGRAALVAGVLGIASQAGDLLESGIKRHFGVKDSGRLIPGAWRPAGPVGWAARGSPGRGGAVVDGGPGGRSLAVIPRSVTVLGSTGSVGTSTVDLLAANKERFRVHALVGGRNAKLLAEQAVRLHATLAVIAEPSAHGALKTLLAGTGVQTATGPDAVTEAAAAPVDWTMAAITGAAGLPSTLAAIRRGGAIALANKEALVCAGEVMLRAVRDAGATLLPVDSEHNAIFQAMAEGNRHAVERIVLTASGGPFRTASYEDMVRATPEAALRHPVWSMGAKISIDSATMMNKGLELIEAARLFGLDESCIGVLVHPQSVVHGIVHYRDGSMLAQLGAPDMRIPIAHALAWPDRLATASPRLDLAALGRLEFHEPDPVRFPALRLARDALRAGGGAPTILSAANEVAVDAFLARRLGFTAIADLVSAVLDRLGSPGADTLDAVMDLDAAARRTAEGIAAAKAA